MAPPDDWRPQHPLIGQLLASRYQVASFIREGGMAQVFCGLQDEEPHHVAIKVVHPELAEDEEIVARFLREAELAARLVHPNIVRILAVGEEGDLLYMVMELLFGEDLSAPAKMRGTFSEARAAKIIAEVCDALQFAHEQGIIHRDVKPENIMICRQPDAPEREVVKVLDFGIAKILDAKSDVALPTEAPTSVRSVLTRVGALVGTPAYISPEQGRAEQIDHRADIYSVGVVLYELVCGKPLFEGQTALQIVARHVQEAPPPPSKHCAVHPGLEALILRAIAKKPSERPQTAKELGDALRALLPELSPAPIERWLPQASSAPGPWTSAPQAALARTIGVAAAGGPAAAPSSAGPDSPGFDAARTTRLDPPLTPEALRRATGGAAPGPSPPTSNTGLTPVATPRRPTVDWRPDHPFIGRVLGGRFRVASFIREGGMAQVFCGTQRGDPPHVAVKIVHPDLAQDREVVARFLREAKLAAHLVHPNIVRIVSVGQDGDALYLVMELLFGDDLSAPIKQRGSFSEARAAQIVADVCDALQHAHDHGVVHRDIKPENVMLCRQPHAPLEEVVKVLDFGIAKVLDAKPDAALPLEAPTGVRSVLTRVGMLVGTPAYMSPEQGSARPIDHRSDIYSAGILLYELICGVPPFEGETPLQIVARHVHEQPRPPSQHTPVYPALEALILKMLEKDPNRRPPTAAAVAEALRGMQRDLSNVVGVALAPDERWLNRMARRATTNTAASSSRRGKRQEPTPLEPQPTLPSQPAPSASNGALAPPSTPTPRVATHPPSVPAPSRDAQPGGAATASSPVRPSADAIRLMKQTVPLRPGAPVASPSPPRRAPAEALRTAPMTAATPPSVTTGPASSSAAAPATLRSDSSPPSSAGSAVEKRLQARVDRLVRMLTILGAIVGVAFLVIIGLVVVLFLMR